jgi:hypothetical protein
LDNCRNEADTTKFRPQLTEETTAIARPFTDGGNISLSNIQVIGPNPNEKAHT